MRLTCPDCKGTGRRTRFLVFAEKCSLCRGLGDIPEATPHGPRHTVPVNPQAFIPQRIIQSAPPDPSPWTDEDVVAAIIVGTVGGNPLTEDLSHVNPAPPNHAPCDGCDECRDETGDAD